MAEGAEGRALRTGRNRSSSSGDLGITYGRLVCENGALATTASGVVHVWQRSEPGGEW